MGRFKIILATVLVMLAALYLLLPSFSRVLLERWLSGQGYRDLTIQLGYPGLTSLSVPTLRLTQDVGSERLSLTLQDLDIQYSLSTLLTGRVTHIVLPRATVQLAPVAVLPVEAQERRDDREDDEDDESFNPWTVGDLTQTIPLFPFEALTLGEVTVTRAQATGPLRTFTLSGTVRQGTGPLQADLAIQGHGMANYRVTLSGQSAAALSLRLFADNPLADSIIDWQSDALPAESQTTLQGRLQVNVRELAPFVAWVMPIGPEWQAVTGTVLASWAGTASSSVPLAAAWRDPGTKVQGQLQFHARLPELKGFGKEVAVGVVATVEGNATRMTCSLAPSTLLSAVVNARNSLFAEAIRTAVPSGRQPLRIEVARDVVGTVESTESPARLTVDGPIAVSYGTTTGSSRTEVTLTHLVMRGGEVEGADGLLRFEGNMPKALRDLLPAREVMGTLQGTLALDREGIRTLLLPPSQIRIRDWRQGDLELPHGEIDVQDALPARWEFSTSRWVAGPSALSVRLPEVRWAGRKIATQHSTVQIVASEGSATAWRLRGAWQIKGLVPLQPPWPIPPTDWTVTFDTDQSQATADVYAEAHERRFTLAAQVSHNFASQQGAVQGTVGPVSFDRTLFRLSQVKTPWPYPFDLTEGQASAKVDGTWGTDGKNLSQGIQLRSGTMSLSLSGLSGRYRNILVNGVTSTITLQATGWPALAMPQSAALSIASINSGVELTNVAMTLQPEWQGDGTLSAVAVRDIRLKMLGGEVTSQGLKAVVAAPSHTLPLTLHSLDLQKILSLEQQKGLQGTGVLDGTLPVTISSTGVSVKDATLAARPPGGVIRYVASAEATKAVTQANANMQLVLQALNNFQYNVLQVGAQYVEDGTLNLAVRLEGRNPDQKKSPPIHFNLTVQENIPALLKSLRLVQGIEESVQKKFRRPSIP